MTRSRLLLLCCPVLAAMVAGPARAFPILPQPVAPIPVLEYHNTILDHYFLTSDNIEIAVLDTGLAGPGWVRTGMGFKALPVVYTLDAFSVCPDGGCGAVVTRFYGTPGLGPNSHFYTLVADEVDGLRQPGTGWTPETQAFRLPAPFAGTCPPGTVPIYRLYNNRWMYNDSNHRYVTTQALRAKMVSLGWIDEDVRMCTAGPLNVTLAGYAAQGDVRVRTGANCGEGAVGSCVLVNGLPLEDQRIQGPMESLRVNLDSSRRTQESPGIDVAYQVPKSTTPADTRLFPWGHHEMETDFVFKAGVTVRSVNLRSPGAAAYGRSIVEFRDVRSGHALDFAVGAYGTGRIVDFPGDSTSVDPRSGNAVVATVLRYGNTYVRSVLNDALRISQGANFAGSFQYGMNREEFMRVISAARIQDPALSLDPDDYFVDTFRFTNTAIGDVEIDLGISPPTIAVNPRP